MLSSYPVTVLAVLSPEHTHTTRHDTTIPRTHDTIATRLELELSATEPSVSAQPIRYFLSS